MTISDSKGRFFYKRNRFESIRITNRIESRIGMLYSRRLTSLSGDSRETSFLFQRLSMLTQRFNSALIMDSCFSDEDRDL